MTLHENCHLGEQLLLRRAAMGTWFEVLATGPDTDAVEAAAQAALDEVDRLAASLSRFDVTSEVARINREARGVWRTCDEDLFTLLSLCLSANRATGGYFDITAPTSRAVNNRVCKEREIGLPIELDVSRRSVRLRGEDVQIDLGGIGKGYALDRAAAWLRTPCVESALLHGGTSSVLAVNPQAMSDSWPIQLHDPFSVNEEAVLPGECVMLRNEGFSCSAAMTNRVQDNDAMRQSDIVNPMTGAPLTSQTAVAIVAPTATLAEIWSTALVAIPIADRPKYLQTMREAGVRALVIEPPQSRQRYTWLT